MNRPTAKTAPTIRRASKALSRRGRPAGLPPRRRHDVLADHSVLVLLDLLEHRLHEGLRQQVGLEAEVEELRVLRVVVVLLLLEPGVLDVVDGDLQAVLLAG